MRFSTALFLTFLELKCSPLSPPRNDSPRSWVWSQLLQIFINTVNAEKLTQHLHKEQVQT